ncbi:GM14401 [Drosophila sechellia]|uniref:GM14401 n=1 Tax=Drosophila sechellia TaxID=7238 RepID=B4HXP7_DROSE|nr:GM14401 [Drosophila sechellia]
MDNSHDLHVRQLLPDRQQRQRHKQQSTKHIELPLTRGRIEENANPETGVWRSETGAQRHL